MSDSSSGRVPTEITLHKRSRLLEIQYADGVSHRLSAEFLRVMSPSAEVRGHGPGQDVLQVGKKQVEILALEPVGSYAVKLIFSDGHDTGLYSWDFLYEIGRDQSRLWQGYLERLRAAGAQREGPGEVADAPANKSVKSGWKTL